LETPIHSCDGPACRLRGSLEAADSGRREMTCGFSASAERTGKARATAEEPHSIAGSSTRETSSKLEVVSALESRIEPIAKARIVSTASATVMASDAKALEARERNKG